MTHRNVYIVGAGPGDPSLLTLKAKQLLEIAEVVLVDHLVHPSILQHCSATANIINVGKKKGHHSRTQETINQLLMTHFQNNKCVVRLKGGDPMIFGRGGEEMQALIKANIPFEVVPGITSAIAVPTLAGIPLTHRELSRSVAFVTGTLCTGDPNHQLPVADTLVILMAVSHLSTLVPQLIGHGSFTKNTPISVISQGTTANQIVVNATLETIQTDLQKIEIPFPALLVVGEVAKLSKTFNWKSNQPLHNKRVVVVRAKGQASLLADQLSLLGAEVVIMPMIETCPNQRTLKKLTKDVLKAFTMVVFTSQNGVKYFFEDCFKKQIDARLFANKLLVTVGPKTTQALKQYGILTDIQAKKFTTEGLTDALPQNLSEHHILLPLAKKAQDILQKECQKRGATVTKWDLYDTLKPPDQQTGIIKDGDVVMFTSGSTAEHFFNSPNWQNQAIIPISIGPKTTQKIKDYFNKEVVESPESTLQSLINKLVSYQGASTCTP